MFFLEESNFQTNIMLLAIDIGNSNIVLGIYDKNTWIRTWRMSSSMEKTAEEYGVKLRSYFLEENIKVGHFQKVVLSSVVPDLTHILAETMSDIYGLEVLILNPKIYPKLPIQINNPKEIGTDLVANTLAAHQHFQDTCIVVDFGTALTFTTISAQGKILGVAIAPGLKTAMYALYDKTAQLPEVPLEMPKTVLGNNTSEALQAGVIAGYEGLVRFMIDKIEKEINTSCKKIATGGLLSIIPSLQRDVFDKINQNLTLDGLRLVAEII